MVTAITGEQPLPLGQRVGQARPSARPSGAGTFFPE
jgi:hypothetical protein